LFQTQLCFRTSNLEDQNQKMMMLKRKKKAKVQKVATKSPRFCLMWTSAKMPATREHGMLMSWILLMLTLTLMKTWRTGNTAPKDNGGTG
ncbi:hypothetical protein GGI23_005615, partial [Coemansia sp. RSA 2559]